MYWVCGCNVYWILYNKVGDNMKTIIANINGFDNIIVTKHAQARGKKRLNLGSKNLVNLAKHAFVDGLDYFKTITNKDDRNISKIKNGVSANNIKIYGHGIFIMNDNVLLTVLALPKNLWGYWDNRPSVSCD